MTRKRRTRAHVLEDLSRNHVERFVFRCSFSAERITSDYGIDLSIFTYTHDGELENGSIGVQLKATDSLQVVNGGSAVAFTAQKAHLEHWLSEPMPVILIVYDAKQDAAYYLYIQRYFELLPGFDLALVITGTTVHIPVSNVLDESVMRQFAAFKQAVLNQVQGVIRHA
ncbi:MAG TPA: DUF4365 domain-containing protein [Symbiobacteriaceae bacterium]|nr:DUF4365 domain-containing protein [Symbiobacteriaceae bacterium]